MAASVTIMGEAVLVVNVDAPNVKSEREALLIVSTPHTEDLRSDVDERGL